MVNTFILSSDNNETARLLRQPHLVKQITEGFQILSILEGTNKGKGFVNHPAVKMWEGYTEGLKDYIYCMMKEAKRREYKVNSDKMKSIKQEETPEFPNWFYNKRMHECHRAMLCHKHPEYLEIFEKAEYEINTEHYKGKYGYIWPSKIKKSDWKKPLSEITEPLNKDLVNPRYCPALIQSGKNKGNACNILLRGSDKYCGRHKKNHSSKSSSESSSESESSSNSSTQSESQSESD